MTRSPINDDESPASELQRRSYELSVLNDVVRSLNASVDLSSMLQRALERVAELLGLHTGWVLLFDERTGQPSLAASLNLPPGLREEPERMSGWCFCLDSFRKGKFSGAANIGVVSCSRLRKLAMARGETAGFRFHASIPLKVYEDGLVSGETTNEHDPASGRTRGFEDEPAGHLKRLGMLNVVSREWRELTSDELNLLRTIGDMLSVGIERARLHARRLESAQSEERIRLAREIHDTIAQDLSALVFQLDAAEALMQQGAAADRILDNVAAARDLARKGLDDARRSVLDLRPAPLKGRTLPQALAELARQTHQNSTSNVQFECAPDIPSISSAIEAGLFRIAQEAVQNALRHAGAERLTIRLQPTATGLTLEVEDDGKGFDTGDTNLTGGRHGLIGMRERARLLGGRLQIESSQGVGTRIAANVPLERTGRS